MTRLFFSVVLSSILFAKHTSAQNINTKFGRNEILEDLEYLYSSLDDAHYDLYAYTSKEKFNENYRHVRASIIADSISSLEATNLFQKVISAANNGHTEIDFPGAAYGAYAYNGGTIFPLEIAFENDKYLIRKNFSDHQDIKIGLEIMSINGMAMDAVLAKIHPQVSAERTYFKNTKIELYSFPRLYWQVFGRQDNFEVAIKEKENITSYMISAVDLIEGYEKKRDEVLNAQMQLKFLETSAYINPGNFAGDEQKYQRFIDSAFVKIKETAVKNLIIDLRNNGGGNDSFSDYLVSYIADKPFKWNSKLTIKTSEFLKAHTRKNSDTTTVYFKQILNHKNGELFEFETGRYQPQAKSKRFDGKVYVLVNRQSHSQAAVTAAQIQDYDFGTIVGEETGDYPSLYASQFQYPLPNTGIPVKVSKGYIVRVNGSRAQKGVVPDIVIQDHLLDENDEILDGLLSQLN
ncbi:S41 family peptidase [uncultured Croceitalea sp.]|uniref:S41 family peptidase n=1 Tax=uncultured Croceitalea sp. TaxID=1798908 RepID=UPI003305F703